MLFWISWGGRLLVYRLQNRLDRGLQSLSKLSIKAAVLSNISKTIHEDGFMLCNYSAIYWHCIVFEP
jgi:hypothetical protein